MEGENIARILAITEIADMARYRPKTIWLDLKEGRSPIAVKVVWRKGAWEIHGTGLEGGNTFASICNKATYNISWRCWSDKPTNEQLYDTPWELDT